MLIKQLQLGPMGNYVYLIGGDSSGLCAVIDPAWDSRAIEKEAEKLGLKIDSVLLTHGHFDHVNAAETLLSGTGLAATAHEEDISMLPPGLKTVPLRGDCSIKAGGLVIEVLHTPGHTPGSCCYMAEKNLFTGDTLFIGECGRVDLEGSSQRKMRESLAKLASLPDDTKVFPGHAYADSPDSTIAMEKKHNPWIKRALRNRADIREKQGNENSCG
ncbi:MAG: MBL fold metallo-hydrolase [bacterium]